MDLLVRGIILDYQTISIKIAHFTFIAVVHNLAKVWVSYN